VTKRERDELAALAQRVAVLEEVALEIRTGIKVFIWIGKLGVALGTLLAFFKGASSWDSVADGFRSVFR